MGLEIIALLSGIITLVTLVVGYAFKKKAERNRDHDALARVESDELAAGMERVDRLYPRDKT